LSQTPENKTYNLNISHEDLQAIGRALDDRPYKEAAPIIQRLNQQIQSQAKPPAPLPTNPNTPNNPSPSAKPDVRELLKDILPKPKKE
jgi:hypothetical protein